MMMRLYYEFGRDIDYFKAFKDIYHILVEYKEIK